MSNRLKLRFALPILLATSGCAVDSIAPVATGDYCRIARPISYDTATDSAETVKAIEEHNSRYVCVCEQDCPRTGSNPSKP